jgi:hypothetical protein
MLLSGNPSSDRQTRASQLEFLAENADSAGACAIVPAQQYAQNSHLITFGTGAIVALFTLR